MTTKGTELPFHYPINYHRATQNCIWNLTAHWMTTWKVFTAAHIKRTITERSVWLWRNSRWDWRNEDSALICHRRPMHDELSLAGMNQTSKRLSMWLWSFRRRRWHCRIWLVDICLGYVIICGVYWEICELWVYWFVYWEMCAPDAWRGFLARVNGSIIYRLQWDDSLIGAFRWVITSHRCQTECDAIQCRIALCNWSLPLRHMDIVI